MVPCKLSSSLREPSLKTDIGRQIRLINLGIHQETITLKIIIANNYLPKGSILYTKPL